MREEISNWIKQAKVDLRAGKHLFDSGDYTICAFLCQQTAEKALKALLIYKERDIIKTHDLVFLGKRLKAPESVLDICKLLTPIYIETRYPGIEGVRKFSKKEAEQDLKSAIEILKWVEKKL